MRRKFIFSFVAVAACLPTTEFVRTIPGERVARPASDVDVYFGKQPTKNHVKVGYFDRTPSDYVEDKGVDLVDDMRRKAGYQGCDGVMIPTKDEVDRLAKSSTEKARAYCIMYSDKAPVAAADKPVNEGDEHVRVGAAHEAAGALDEAEKEYELACRLPHQRGCTHLGILLLGKKEETKALELFTRACALDDGVACRYLGVMYVEGKGTKASALGGVQYLDKACTAKDGWACWRIAQVLKSGEGGAPKDQARAATYMALACNNGHKDACE